MLLVLTPSYCAIILKALKRLNVRVLLHVLYHSKIEEVLLLKLIIIKRFFKGGREKSFSLSHVQRMYGENSEG